MKDEIAIKVHNLHKSFDIAENKKSSIKQFFVGAGKKSKKQRQKVLDGIDFEIKKGEFFGIVGRNGSGKSTLLKLLAGVYTPDKGAVEINGNLTPFIELGVGFNPELSGRDNVYLSSSLLGYTRKQVDEMYDDIVAFAELEEHMDKKLKNYSSGMQVRLAFSIAIKAKNDILIFDEVLAVGDEAFQRKCLNVFEEYRREGQTVVLVTHNMDSVRSLCTRAMIISNGVIDKIGNVGEITERYSNINAIEGMRGLNNKKHNTLIDVEVHDNKQDYLPGDTLKIKMSWRNDLGVNKIGVALHRTNGEYVFGSNSTYMTGRTEVEHKISLDLGPGGYFLTIIAADYKGEVVENIETAWRFYILDDNNKDIGGQVRLKYTYK